MDINKYFFKPVDAENVPYYKKVVNEPMDFETMCSKALVGRYLQDPTNLIKSSLAKILPDIKLFQQEGL